MDPQLMVVGGGPIGSTVAAFASSLQTVVVEEHEEVGSPVQCTGLVHPRVVEMAGASETVINSITGLKIFFPGGRVVEVPSPETKAMVIDRRRFDELCSRKAETEGADILTNHSFKGFERAGGRLKVRLDGPDGEELLTTDILIGADGYKSRVGKEAGLGPAKEVVRGIQVDLMTRLEDQSKVEVHLGREIAPGFFAWVLPCGDFTRVGLCVAKDHGAPSKYLTSLLRSRGLEEVERKGIASGAIPIGPPKQTYQDNIMIVGDAAAQTKPLSGGGLFTGMRAARWAAQTAVEAIKAGDCSAKRLADYEARWRADIGKELERGLLIRKVFVGMTDKKLADLGKMLDRGDVKDVLATGDIDFPSKLATPLLRTLPSLIKFSPQVIGTLIRREQRF